MTLNEVGSNIGVKDNFLIKNWGGWCTLSWDLLMSVCPHLPLRIVFWILYAAVWDILFHVQFMLYSVNYFSKVVTVLQSVISSPSRSALWICYWSSIKENQLSVNCTKLNRETAIPRKSNFNKIINKNNCNLITNLLVLQKYITDYKDSYSSVFQVWKYGNKHASGWSNTSFISK